LPGQAVHDRFWNAGSSSSSIHVDPPWRRRPNEDGGIVVRDVLAHATYATVTGHVMVQLGQAVEAWCVAGGVADPALAAAPCTVSAPF
jgi:hypothetical protein